MTLEMRSRLGEVVMCVCVCLFVGEERERKKRMMEGEKED